MKKASVIVPAYNAEKYISDCLESICRQTYKNIEILIVNDGSSDRTCEIIKGKKAIDHRIILFDNENHGVSFSRNYAMLRSSGDYISFVDADDIIADDFIETLVEAIEKYDADAAAVNVAKKEIFSTDLFSNGSICLFQGEKKLEELFGVYEGFLCNKLYKRTIVFDNCLQLDAAIAVSEDLMFNVEYMLHADKVVYNSGVKYFYRQDNMSAVRRLSNRKWFDVFSVYDSIFVKIQGMKNAEVLADYCYRMLLLEASYRLNYIDGNTEYLKNSIAKRSAQLSSRSKFNYKQRIKLALFSFFPKSVMIYKQRRL